MDTTRSSVIAAFSNIRDAQRAVSELHSAGFPAQEVKLIANDQDMSLDNNRTDSTWSRTYPAEPERKGGVMNFFASLFGLDDDDQQRRDRSSANLNLHQDSEQYFTDHYQQGRHLVVVYTTSDRTEAVRILNNCGGIVEDRGNQLYDQEYQRTRSMGLQGQSLGAQQTIQLRDEELVANKETVQTGEVTLRKEVVTETRTIEVPVSREEVVIERHALNGREGATAGSINMSSIGEGEEIRIPVSEERLTIDKKVVPREEIHVSKQRVERTEQVSEDLRHEELEIERDGEVSMRGESIRDEELTEAQRAQRRKDKEMDKDRTPGSRPYL